MTQMPKRMRSQDGGFMHAYTEQEEAYLCKLGWTAEVVQRTDKPEVTKKRGRPAKGKDDGANKLHRA